MISILSNWRGYLELTKPGVQALLFVSCASGMLIGSDFSPPVLVFFFGLIGISFLAASSAVINHFFDQKIDSKMNRTSERPLVVGKISDKQAIIFSIILYLSGSWMLLFFTNFLTWLLTTLTFIFYGFIYTKYLKFMTSQNIVIGGAGKTPVALKIGKILIEAGYKPHFISKGYAGILKKNTLVQAWHSPKSVGDEPLLLADVAPTWIGINRNNSIKLINKFLINIPFL